jgi:hypothetical protein
MGLEILLKIGVTIIVSILTWLFLKLTDKVIIPWFEKLSYKGAIIKGTWSSASTLKHKQYEKTKFHEHFNLSQNAQKLTGDYTVKSEHEDGTFEIAVYKIAGTVIQNYVTMTCIIDNQREVGIVNFLFHISGGGDKLEGHALWINRMGIEIETHENITFLYKK